MNASFPATSAPAKSETTAVPRAKSRRSWLVSVTLVCFVFGGLLASQLRAIQNVHENEALQKKGQKDAQLIAAKMKEEAAQSEKDREIMQKKIAALQLNLKNSGSLSIAQVTALNTQIKELQSVAGLTAVTGPGIRMVLSDDPQAAAASNGAGGFLPGIVHDFDLLQAVNELRLAKADAIAIHGADGEVMRVTGYTPIRCVGSPIMVNWEPVAAPFTIEAVGDPKTLLSALKMPGGIVENLKNSGLGVKVVEVKKLELPSASGGAPRMKVAKVLTP